MAKQFVSHVLTDVSSDYDTESDNPSKPLNLAIAVRQYHQQQKEQRELSGPLLASCGDIIKNESIVHFPVGPLRQETDEFEVIDACNIVLVIHVVGAEVAVLLDGIKLGGLLLWQLLLLAVSDATVLGH